jgi:uroporphyrinogen-III synthase
MSFNDTHSVFLITKPEHQAKNLCAQIENLGGRCILFPTLTIKTLPAEQIAKAISQLSSTDKIIFTSANAVHPVIPHWSALSSAAVFAVGPGTASALANLQITAKIPTEFSSEGLLALPDLQTVHHQQIVIFSGIGGRTRLQEELKKRGATVQKIAVYQRECPVLTAIFPPIEKISLVISTSEESLKNLWAMVGPEGQTWLKEQRLLVISTEMQRLAQRLGFKHPAIRADNASDEAILLRLERLKYSKQTKQHKPQ